jgi:predicted dienelactone hydrolase
MRALRFVLAVLVVMAAALAVAYALRAPEPPAAGSESARRLEPGPHRVASLDLDFSDASRATDPNGDYAGAPARAIAATLWYPEGVAGLHPLVVYSHGFMSWRAENAPFAELAASHGYVVVAIDFPLTNGRAPGGPNVRDVVNQPGDVRFVIDSVLAWKDGERPFAGEIDRARIGVIGLSLGGLTTELVAFHPRMRDPRVAAAVSIAGPASMLTPSFFASADIPFLMIAGTGDAMIPYAANAAPTPAKLRRGGLVSIEGGTHAGFAVFSDMFPLRLLGNPDSLGCYALTRNLGDVPDGNPFPELGSAAEGVVIDSNEMLPCQGALPSDALSAGRQQMITRLAALAFFESYFAADPALRAANDAYLRETLATDFAEARFAAAGG